MAKYPDSTKASLEQRLRARARERWPQIASLQIRHRGVFSYVDATLADATTLKLCRLRYVGSASQWQFAIYRASHDDYDESVFFTGLPVGTCQDALDTACGLYLNDPTAWAGHPTNLRAGPLRPSQARVAMRRLPHARFVPLPGCGHVPMTDDPVLVASVLLDGSGR
jgi:pimeloyl-ACP methyl ester carboxylesterase